MKTGFWNRLIFVALPCALGLACLGDMASASGARATKSAQAGADQRAFPPPLSFAQGRALARPNAGFSPAQAGRLLVPTAAKIEAGRSVVEDEVKALISRYKVDDPATRVMAYIQRMPAPVSDARFRGSVRASLPAEFISYLMNDPALTLATRKALAPVLDLYGRTKVYDIILLNHPVPLLMSDSGVLLCLTTGLLRRMKSEDELLGYVAHEVGHEWLARRSVELRREYEGFVARGADKQANLATEKLALIELEADIFATLTLAYLGRGPVEYARSIERVAEEYSDVSIGHHPPAWQRTQVITSVVPQRVLNLAPRKTAEFIALQEALAKRRKRPG